MVNYEIYGKRRVRRKMGNDAQEEISKNSSGHVGENTDELNVVNRTVQILQYKVLTLSYIISFNIYLLKYKTYYSLFRDFCGHVL